MDKILPIVIGLIWIGFKLYQKNMDAAKKAEQTPLDSTSSSDSFIDTAFENFKNQFIEPVLQTDFIGKTNYENYKEEEIIKSDKIDNFNNEESFLNKERKTTLAPILEYKEPKNSELQIIDLRKAMIYHAIFDRPYN